jgi:AcrR family transcriptional regulator
MPYPAQISVEAIAQTARDIIEREGLENLSFKKLADELGVTPPALYRLIADRTDLLRVLRLFVYAELLGAIRESLQGTEAHPGEGVIAFARTYRGYMRRYPVTATLIFSHFDPKMAQLRGLNMNDLMFKLLHDKMLQITGDEDRAVSGLMGLWSLIHGFTLLENGDSFSPQSGPTDERFDYLVHKYLAGWEH